MSEEEQQQQEPAAPASDDQKTSMAAYLQAPRKKRKNYVIIAAQKSFDKVTISQIEGYVGKYHSHLALGRPTNLQDLRRHLNRNVSLLVLDDEFSELDGMLQMILKVRERRKAEIIPILFMTRDPQKLILAYHETLGVYQEIDEFVEYASIERSQIIGRVKVGIEQKNRRRSRRFKVRSAAKFFLLRRDEILDGQITDMSMHGATLRSMDGEIFKVGDQLKITIPGQKFIGYDSGEYLRLSARVRRVFINGSTAGVSFEYVSDKQNLLLTKFLAGIMTGSAVS